MDAGCTEPHLGLATTQELFVELIARCEHDQYAADFDESVNFLRGMTLRNILSGMDEETRTYRTVD